MSNPTEIFIQKAIAKPGNIYNYDQVLYVKAKNKVIIVCAVHGEFAQTPNNHLQGNGCPACCNRFSSGSNEKAQHATLAAATAHGDAYDYSMVNFCEIPKGKVTIICKAHGPFKQLWGNHVGKCNQNGCPQCGRTSASQKQQLGKDIFVARSIAAHGAKYDYSACDYTGAHTKVSIICSNHGAFLCTPVNHYSNHVGCPQCLHSNPSKGEAKIAQWLDLH